MVLSSTWGANGARRCIGHVVETVEAWGEDGARKSVDYGGG